MRIAHKTLLSRSKRNCLRSIYAQVGFEMLNRRTLLCLKMAHESVSVSFVHVPKKNLVFKGLVFFNEHLLEIHVHVLKCEILTNNITFSFEIYKYACLPQRHAMIIMIECY